MHAQPAPPSSANCVNVVRCLPLFLPLNIHPTAQLVTHLTPLSPHTQAVDPNLVKLADAFRIAAEKLGLVAGATGGGAMGGGWWASAV